MDRASQIGASETETPAQIPVSPAVAARGWRARLAARLPRWQWTRRWEIWAILVVGSFLRLWRLDVANFYADSGNLMALARQSVLQHALPITGIGSSIGTLNPPTAVYLLLPFAAISANPLLPTVAIALWSILGIVLCYIFADRYFGRIVAAVGTLLFAFNPWTVSYSRFIWQQNVLPTLVILWALTLYGGCVRGNRRWFVANALLLAVAILLHTSAAFLIPVSLVAILLAPHRPRLREYAVVAAVVVVLLIPTALFEVFSQGFDISILKRFFTMHGHFDLVILDMARSAIEGPDANALGAGTPYGQFDTLYAKVTKIALVLLLCGLAALTVRVVAPAVRIWLDGQNGQDERRGAALRSRLLALWRGLRSRPEWRAYLLLWLWIAVPIVGMLHHSNNLHVHYLMVLYPAIFLVSGLAVRDALVWAPGYWRRLAQGQFPRLVAAGWLVPVVALLLLAGVTAGYLFRAGIYLDTLATGQFSVGSTYAEPLNQAQALDADLTTLQRKYGASSVYLSLPFAFFNRDSLQYLLASERPDRVTFPDTCLLLPAASEGSVLFASLASNAYATQYLDELPGARVVAQVPDGGAAPLPIYLIPGGEPQLADEQAVTPTVFRDGAGNVLRLEGASLADSYMLRLRWTILGVANNTNQGSRPWYEFMLHGSGHGSAKYPQMTDTTCDLTAARAGVTLITFLPLAPQVPQNGTITPNDVRLVGPVTLQAHAGALAQETASLGPLRLLTGRYLVTPDTVMAPSPALAGGANTLPGSIMPGNQYALPASLLAP